MFTRGIIKYTSRRASCKFAHDLKIMKPSESFLTETVPWTGILNLSDLLPLGGFSNQFKVPMSSTGLVAELERLAIAVSGQEPREEEISLPSVAERVAKVFGVKPDEVAVLAVSAKWRHL